jgi:hypothetical protein
MCFASSCIGLDNRISEGQKNVRDPNRSMTWGEANVAVMYRIELRLVKKRRRLFKWRIAR